MAIVARALFFFVMDKHFLRIAKRTETQKDHVDTHAKNSIWYIEKS